MSKQSILVTGGAGYIGSHASLALQSAGFNVVILDDLSKGHKRLVPKNIPLVIGNCGDKNLLQEIFSHHKIDTVMHFAASVVVSESVTHPLKYFYNNSINSANLISACVEYGVKNFIFSSTAAVYGIPENVPVEEEASLAPINPYGNSKRITETILQDVADAHDLHYVILRYFNVAGADPEERSGQICEDATHLIKVAAELATGKREQMFIYGDDYPTPDGTCIRDYIHVSDLAEAHVKALQYLQKGGENEIINCGYGHGYSVKEIVDTVEKIRKIPLNVAMAGRRAGDPPELIAGVNKIKKILNWSPKFNDIETIIRSAIAWEEKL